LQISTTIARLGSKSAWLAIIFLAAAPRLTAACHGSPALEAKLQAESSVKAFTDLGIWFRQHSQFGCAAEVFDQALQKYPGSARLEYLLGASLYSSGDAKDAIAPLQASVRIDPKVLQSHLILAAALDRMRDATEAATEWRAALALDPKSATARQALSKDLLATKDYSAEIALLRADATSGHLTADLTLDLAIAYGKMGLLQDANVALRSALRTHPASLPLAKALAATLVLQSRREEAAAILLAAMKQHPADLEVQVLYLRILVMQDEAEKGKQLGAKLLQLAPENWNVLYLNGVLERVAGEYEAARAHLLQAVALNPNDSECRRNLGSVLAKLNDPQRAKEQLEKAIALGSRDPEVRFELAGVLRTLGEDREAEEQLKLYQQEAQEKSDLTQAGAKSAFADQKLAAGNLPEAIDLYRQALAAAPHEAVLAYKLAMALDKAGDTVAERAALEQAIQIDPNLAEAQNQLGFLQSRDGETASAEEHFRIAVRASPGFARAWVNLAAMLYLESKLPEAKEAVQRALQIEPDNAGAQKLRSALNAGQTP
jgi:tetratricopeptide (TPR) repeat protein